MIGHTRVLGVIAQFGMRIYIIESCRCSLRYNGFLDMDVCERMLQVQYRI